jgi:hypothetical protein
VVDKSRRVVGGDCGSGCEEAEEDGVMNDVGVTFAVELALVLLPLPLLVLLFWLRDIFDDIDVELLVPFDLLGIILYILRRRVHK